MFESPSGRLEVDKGRVVSEEVNLGLEMTSWDSRVWLFRSIFKFLIELIVGL